MDRKQGLEPAVSGIISNYRQDQGNKLLLVIRDTLLEQAIVHYHLQGASIIHHLKDLT